LDDNTTPATEAVNLSLDTERGRRWGEVADDGNLDPPLMVAYNPRRSIQVRRVDMQRRQRNSTVVCQICKKEKKPSDVIAGELVRAPLVEIIQRTYPDWSQDGFICVTDLNEFRARYVREALEKDKGELTALEEQVSSSFKERELLSKNVNLEFERKLTVGEHLADGMAKYAGSWKFMIGFAVVLALWITLNSYVLASRAWDHYPFILLNLCLSCLAAVQAPVIMMSQNRLEAKDRMRAEHDYIVNLKAELEIRSLNEKMDHLLVNQWQRLLEIQQVQTELMQELSRGIRPKQEK
jgi:uncharacterized membrane protein